MKNKNKAQQLRIRTGRSPKSESSVDGTGAGNCVMGIDRF